MAPADAAAPLSSGDREILSICLRSAQDPREIGILPALLSAEKEETQS